MHRQPMVILCCLVALTGAARAQQTQPTQDEVASLIEEYDGRVTAWRESAAEFEALDWSKAPAAEYKPKFKALAEKYAGQPPALEALSWILGNLFAAPGDDQEALAGWAIERLARDHAADPKVEEVLGRTQYLGWIVDHKVLLALYDRVIAANKDKEAQSTATTLKALLIHEGPPGVEPGEKERKERTARALELLRKVVKEYAGTSGAQEAEGYVFELENLQIGMTAPDFAGKGVDEKEIKLSQFRGQVVVLDFWGFW